MTSKGVISDTVYWQFEPNSYKLYQQASKYDSAKREILRASIHNPFKTTVKRDCVNQTKVRTDDDNTVMAEFIQLTFY